MRNSRDHGVEALLRSRRRIEEVARHEFVAAGEEVERLRERLEQLRFERRRADSLARDRLLGGGEADTSGYRSEAARLQAAIDSTTAHMAEAEQNLERCRDELVEAMGRRRSAELLRDRRAARSAADLDRRLARGREEAYAVRLAIGHTFDDGDNEESI